MGSNGAQAIALWTLRFYSPLLEYSNIPLFHEEGEPRWTEYKL
jgi:hypothetical protein